MSVRRLSRRVARIVLCMVAAALLAAMSTRATLAQQPAAANAGVSGHLVASSENEGGGERDVPIGLPSGRSTKLGSAGRAPQLKIAPANERSIVHGSSTILDRNAIGLAIPRPDAAQRPAALNLGHAAGIPPLATPAPSGGAALFGSRSLPAPRIAAQPLRPLVLNRGAIDGAAFTRPATGLKPLGGPAKPAATGINGTSFRPKP